MRKVGGLIMRVAVVLLGMLLAVHAFGPRVYDVYGVSVRASLSPAQQGHTVLEIPPVGSLSAHTHATPLRVNLTVTGVQPEEWGPALASEDQAEILNRIESDTKSPLVNFALFQAGVGGLGAGLLYWALFRPRMRFVLLAALGGLICMGFLMGATWGTYNRDAFREPEYHGMIEAAPRVLHLADELVGKLQDFQDKTDLLVRNMRVLYGQVDRLDLFENDGDRKVLVVSDIHNNFVALEFISSLARHFEADMVLDAGDLTDFGSGLETRLLQTIAALEIPYVFVPGNHDSPQVMEFMRGLPNVILPEGEILEIDGIRILGSPDPLAYGDKVTPGAAGEARALLKTQAETLRRALQNAPAVPDIIITHHPFPGREFTGTVDTLISGHTHQAHISSQDGSLLVCPGSAGAVGLRGLQSENEVPYTAVILHYAGRENLVVAADLITYHALSGSFTVERRLLAETGAVPSPPVAGPHNAGEKPGAISLRPVSPGCCAPGAIQPAVIHFRGRIEPENAP